MQTDLEPELIEEIKGLMKDGFKAAWMKDLKIGDIFAGPRMFIFDQPRKLFVVMELFANDASYADEGGRFYENRVINMIVRDEDDLERHLAYGHTHEIYIYREG